MVELERVACAINAGHSKLAVMTTAWDFADKITHGHREVRQMVFDFLVGAKSLDPELGECADCGQIALVSDDDSGSAVCVSCALADSVNW